MPATKLKEFFNSSVTFRNTLLLSCQVFITPISQNAVCNRHYSVEQQLCRWLLLSLDRIDDNHLNMTQEVIATLLGVRREGVSEAARGLRDEGIIEYHRGFIKILNRPGLNSSVVNATL